MPDLISRSDLLHAGNLAQFYLRHYAKGIYPVLRCDPARWSMPVNRLFIPLRNPNKEANFIRDRHRRYALKENALYFIPAYLEGEFRLDRELYFLSIQDNLEVFPGVELFSGCSRMLEIPDVPALPELLRLFDTPPEERELAALKFGSLIFSMQTALIDRYPPEEFRRPLALREYRALTDFLDGRGSARCRVSELAAMRNESRESFSRNFRKRTGITPKQLIDHFLMRKAFDLLVSGCSVKETAFQLEFSNEFVFSRFFRRQMGESPKRWSRRNGLFPENPAGN